MWRTRWLVRLLHAPSRLLYVGVWLVLLLSAQARAQTMEPPGIPEHPSQRYLRAGSIMLGLAGASTALAAGLLPTQPQNSWGEGAGVAHAGCAVVYGFDGVVKLVRARRISRAAQRHSVGTDRAPDGMLWFNFASTAGATVMGVTLAAVPGDDFVRGVGVSVAAHGAWLFSYAIAQLVRVHRGKSTWMARRPGAISF